MDSNGSDTPPDVPEDSGPPDTPEDMLDIPDDMFDFTEAMFDSTEDVKEIPKHVIDITEDEDISEISDASDGSEFSDSEYDSEAESGGESSSSGGGPPKKKKKSSRKRCAECRKRLTVSNEYKCRCEKWFCSTHRYAEAHKCTFDYKEEGRQIIAAANPVIVAEKIKKI